MPEIIIYTTMLCPYCRSAKRLLRAKGAEFHEIDVNRQRGKRTEMMKKSGRSSVPQIWIGDEHVGGCDDLYALEETGKLDQLLNGTASS